MVVRRRELREQRERQSREEVESRAAAARARVHSAWAEAEAHREAEALQRQEKRESKKKRIISMRGTIRISHASCATTEAVRGTACNTPTSPKSWPRASVEICSCTSRGGPPSLLGTES